MMTLLSKLPKITEKKKKRVGRGLGSGKGAKSGRGTTRHQKARENIPLSFEGGQGRIIKKFPLLRGKGRNKPLSNKPMIIDLEQLNQFDTDETVDINVLIKRGLISEGEAKNGVKILANGKLTKKLVIKIPCSKKVKEMVTELGGKVG
jgi:large subunit ribosomal protein L15